MPAAAASLNQRSNDQKQLAKAAGKMQPGRCLGRGCCCSFFLTTPQAQDVALRRGGITPSHDSLPPNHAGTNTQAKKLLNHQDQHGNPRYAESLGFTLGCFRAKKTLCMTVTNRNRFIMQRLDSLKDWNFVSGGLQKSENSILKKGANRTLEPGPTKQGLTKPADMREYCVDAMAPPADASSY